MFILDDPYLLNISRADPRAVQNLINCVGLANRWGFKPVFVGVKPETSGYLTIEDIEKLAAEMDADKIPKAAWPSNKPTRADLIADWNAIRPDGADPILP